MKINDRFSNGNLVISVLPESSISDVVGHRILRSSEDSRLRAVCKLRNPSDLWFESVGVVRQTAIWESAVYGLVGLCGLAVMLIAFVTAYR
jgi:hypothetical protein